MATLSLVIAVIGILLPILYPEIRQWTGLDPKPRDSATAAPETPVPAKDKQAKQYDKERPAATGSVAGGKLYAYRGIVLDSLDRPVKGIRVLCSTCEQQQTTTDEQGSFLLEKRYLDTDEFRQESVTFSKAAKSITLHLNWREIVPVKF